MIKKLIERLRRNPCIHCDYYHKGNICQSKKVATYDGRITWWDRMWCEPYKAKMDEVEEDEKI